MNLKRILDEILYRAVKVFDWLHVRLMIMGLDRKGTIGRFFTWIGWKSFLVAIRIQRFRILRTMEDNE